MKISRKKKVCSAMAKSKLPPTSIDSLLNKVLSNDMDQMCALCLAEDSLLLLSHSLTLKDAYTDLTVTVRELLDDLLLCEIDGGLLKHICSACITHMTEFYLFKKKCSKTVRAFKNFVKIVYDKASTNSTRSIPRRKTKTLELPYRNIIEYADYTDSIAATKISNGSVTAKTASGNSKYKFTDDNSQTNKIICKFEFINLTDTINPRAATEYAKIEEIIERSDLFACKLCSVADLTWEQYIGHMDVHSHERVAAALLKRKMFCCCCLSESPQNLISVSEEISKHNEQNPNKPSISIELLLCEILMTKELNRFNPILICEDCIDRAIGVYTFQQTYKKSTEILHNCLSQLEQCLSATTGLNLPHGHAMNIRIHFDFNKSNVLKVEPIELNVDWNSDSEATSDTVNGTTEKQIRFKNNTKLYECTKCEKKFSVKIKLIAHSRKHKRNEPHTCRLCHRQFPSIFKLKDHLRAIHLTTVNCTLCHEVFDRKEISAHMEQTHSVQKLICNECNKCFYKKVLLRRHILNKHSNVGNVPVKCASCCVVFNTQYECHKHKCLYNCVECSNYPCIHEKYLQAFQEEETVSPKSIHKCIDCEFSCRTRIALIEHVNKDHLSHYPHLCSTCGEHLPSKKALTNHNTLKHSRFTCQLCLNTFPTIPDLKNHIEECKTLEKPFDCDVCSGRFVSLEKVDAHLKKHFPKMHKCAMCRWKFWTEQELLSHMSRKHRDDNQEVRKPINFPCSMCMLDFSTRKDRLDHEMTHPLDTEHLCRICKATFPTRIERYEHLRNHNRQLDQRCEICGRMFDKLTLLKHLKVHASKIDIPNESPKEKISKPKNYMCDICGELHMTVNTLNRHKDRHKSQQECPHCLTFVPKKSFRRHLLSHESRDGESQDCVMKAHMVKGKLKVSYKKKMECKECNYSTIFEPCYEAHINKYHLKIKPHICKVCNKGFHSRINHMQHVKTHQALKPEQCLECGKSFGSKKALTFHMRLHTGERPFACEFCKMSFVTENRMKEHRSRKHFQPSYPCNMCTKMFYAERYVRKHVREVHLGEKRVRNRTKKKEE